MPHDTLVDRDPDMPVTLAQLIAYDTVMESEPIPNETPSNQPRKFDQDKSPIIRGVLHYFPLALNNVAELSAFGAKKYDWNNWEGLPDARQRYTDALGRHLLAEAKDPYARDPESKVYEATAVAWNALARLELLLREEANHGV